MPSVTITLNDIKTHEDLFTALTALGFVSGAVTVPATDTTEAEDYFPPSEDLRAEINAAEAQKAAKPRGRPKKKDAPPAELEGQQWMPFPEDTTVLAADKPQETLDAKMREKFSLNVEPAPAAEDKLAEEAKELTLDDAKGKGRLLLQSKGADSLRKLIDEYGLRKVGDLPKEKFASFIADCDRLMKG